MANNLTKDLVTVGKEFKDKNSFAMERCDHSFHLFAHFYRDRFI